MGVDETTTCATSCTERAGTCLGVSSAAGRVDKTTPGHPSSRSRRPRPSSTPPWCRGCGATTTSCPTSPSCRTVSGRDTCPWYSPPGPRGRVEGDGSSSLLFCFIVVFYCVRLPASTFGPEGVWSVHLPLWSKVQEGPTGPCVQEVEIKRGSVATKSVCGFPRDGGVGGRTGPAKAWCPYLGGGGVESRSSRDRDRRSQSRSLLPPDG